MATTPAQRKPESSPKYAITIKVTPDLKQRIEQFAAQYNLSISDATRTLLAFAVTEAEDPRTRMLYATYCRLNTQLYRVLENSLRSGVDAMHDWLLTNINQTATPPGD